MSTMHRPIAAAFACLLALVASTPAWAEARNIMLVHGMGGSGSNWHAVHQILTAEGYAVTIVQQPLTGFENDVASTRRSLDAQTAPVVLVGHSYGGVVITTAGNHPAVAALVYVAAIQPDAGETMASLNYLMPSAFDMRGTILSPDGYVMSTRDVFLRDVAQDLPAAEAEFLAASQAWTTSSVFTAETLDPAWRRKPAFGIVATQDRTISPDLERWMYERSGTDTTEVEAGHMVQMSKPREVAEVIMKAARSVE